MPLRKIRCGSKPPTRHSLTSAHVTRTLSLLNSLREMMPSLFKSKLQTHHTTGQASTQVSDNTCVNTVNALRLPALSLLPGQHAGPWVLMFNARDVQHRCQHQLHGHCCTVVVGIRRELLSAVPLLYSPYLLNTCSGVNLPLISAAGTPRVALM